MKGTHAFRAAARFRPAALVGPGIVVALLATGGLAAARPQPAVADGSVCSSGVAGTDAQGNVTCTYTYTGGDQQFTVPTGVTRVSVEAIGAAGAPGRGGAPGGQGSDVTGATIAGLAGNSSLFVEVGGYNGYGGYGGGSYNGGGAGAGAGGNNQAFGVGGAGGGASDVRTNPNDPATRLVVAGGGGGGGGIGQDGYQASGSVGGSGGAAGGGTTAVGDVGAGDAGGAGGGGGDTGGTGGSGGAGGAASTGDSGDSGNGSIGGGGGQGGYYVAGGGGGGGGGGGYRAGGGGGGGGDDANGSSGGGGGGGGTNLLAGGTAQPASKPAEVIITYNTNTPTDTPTNTDTPTDTATNTPVPTDTPTDTPVPTDTATNTPVPTDTPTNTPTDTPTNTSVPSPTTLVVRTTNDPSSCPATPGTESPLSLRCAIAQANADAVGDTIAFAIPTTDPGYDATAGTFTIKPGSRLPFITGAGTTIDGTTQPGYSGAGHPVIVLDDSNALNVTGLNVNASHVTVEGLVVDDFPQCAISVGIGNIAAAVQGAVIQGNYLGVDATGTTARPNNLGMCVNGSGVTNATIGGTTSGAGNVISGNKASGIYIFQGNGTTIEGNYIGVDATGATTLANGGDGVAVNPGIQNTTIGGTTAGAGNVINDNAVDGVALSGGSGSVVAGNEIAHNRGTGVAVAASSTVSAAITQDSIFENGAHGIVLTSQDPDACANESASSVYPSCPTITTATSSQIAGTVANCAGCVVEVFIADTIASDNNHGEGKTYLGSATTDGNGAWTLTTFAQSPAGGQSVTATATRGATAATRQTSAFAADTVVAADATATSTAMNTPVPTDTATNTPTPTDTTTNTPTATNTAVPATNTPANTATNTAVPATNTPVPATATNTPVNTATSTPKPTSTNTAVPATNTPVPATATNTATSTPRPTSTSTPVNTATSTPKPTATSTPRPTSTSTLASQRMLYTAPLFKSVSQTDVQAIGYDATTPNTTITANFSTGSPAYPKTALLLVRTSGGVKITSVSGTLVNDQYQYRFNDGPYGLAALAFYVPGNAHTGGASTTSNCGGPSSTTSWTVTQGDPDDHLHGKDDVMPSTTATTVQASVSKASATTVTWTFTLNGQTVTYTFTP